MDAQGVVPVPDDEEPDELLDDDLNEFLPIFHPSALSFLNYSGCLLLRWLIRPTPLDTLRGERVSLKSNTYTAQRRVDVTPDAA